MLRQVLIFSSLLTLVCLGDDDEFRRSYLQKYGFLDGSGTDEDLYRGLKQFQELNNLTVTGIFDEPTLQIMHRPRCGFPDILPQHYSLYAIKWDKKDLTFNISVLTNKLSENDQKSEIKRAFDEWAKYAPLSFTEQTGEVDIEIKFVKGDHNDGSPFDGEGNVMAHAFYPTNGDIHIDDDENWIINSTTGKDLFAVVLHEIGHSIGIEHSNISNSIMSPYYRSNDPHTKLHTDDIAAVQKLYGVRQPDTEECNFDYDAIMIMNGVKYAFKGTKMMIINDKGKVTGSQTEISATYAGITSVDEVTYNTKNNKVYIFKDGTMYGFQSSAKVSEDYIMYFVKFAFVEGDSFMAYTTEGYKISYKAATMHVNTLGDYDMIPFLSNTYTATNTGDGTVLVYFDKKEHTMVDGKLTGSCTI